jgi:hypothetical protein
MVLEFVEHGPIVPLTGPHEQLQGSSFEARLMGDRFGGFALEAGEFALQKGLGMASLFGAVEAGEIALDEVLQVLRAGVKVLRSNDGVLK